MWRDTVPPQLTNRKVKNEKIPSKNTCISIWRRFEVLAEDSVESIENSILDKIGEKSVEWEYLGEMMDPKINRITYEEVVDGRRPIQTKEVLGAEVAAGV